MKALVILILFITAILSNELKYNSLKNAQSPYLIQHSTNPVNWYEWNEKSLELAKKQNKLIFLSIGYSTCHWCHVMEKESFKNNHIAQLLNKNYISIKIDKEQLPHIDIYYQDILSKLKKRRNGWPLNVILTSTLDIIYISTYIPNSFKYNTEGMDTLIPKIAKEYKENPNKIKKRINKNNKELKKKENIENSKKPKDNLEIKYVQLMKRRYDEIFSGFDKDPKFPLPSHLNLLYEIYQLKGNKKAFQMVNNTLIAFANSGVYDQIEGGFFRYSVYADLIIPHFEKMLYTQAELIPIYYKLYLKTNNPLFKKTIVETIDFTNKTFKNDNNLYFSASDANSLNNENNKQEGFYFTYTYKEIKNAFKENNISNIKELLEYFGVEEYGNFENKLNNIYISFPNEKLQNVNKAISILKELRTKKKKPFIDKKIITSWNAMMIKSIFIASNFDKKYLEMAIKSIKSLENTLFIKNILYHQKFLNNNPSQEALLEDYSFLIDLYLTAYEYTYEKEYLEKATLLYKKSIKKFHKNKQWYLDNKHLYKVSFIDKYYVSAISRLFHSGLTISNLNYDLELLEKTKDFIKNHSNIILTKIAKHPESIRALIRNNHKQITIKSNKLNLLKNRITFQKANYPYILTKEEKSKNYLACDEKSCFENNKDLNTIIRQIDK